MGSWDCGRRVFLPSFHRRTSGEKTQPLELMPEDARARVVRRSHDTRGGVYAQSLSRLAEGERALQFLLCRH